MSHPRVEEVSDSDPSEGDISDIDFDENDIIRAAQPRPSQAQPSSASPFNPSLISPASIPTRTEADGTRFQSAQDESKYKDFQCIYPVYFNAKRSRAEGRRVGKEDAVINPLAREIVTACGRMRLETLFEPAKVHPKDWSNPGRVKVRIKGGQNDQIKNKHHLYKLISQHLKANPTTEATAIQVRVPGAPTPDPSKPYPRPAVPRGWKMDDIIPYYSPAITGGGVSENFFKDMMAEMQGQLPPGMGAAMGEASGSGTETPKKNKKDKKKGK